MGRGSGWGVLAALAAVALLASRKGGSGVPWTASIPSFYARGKLPAMLRRWDDARLRAAAERWGRVFLPGVPVAAVIASGCTSMGPGEYGGPPDYATGLYGIEWPRVERWAADSQTLRELGRAVPTDRPGFTADTEGQTYLGLRGYAAHLAAVLRELPDPLRASSGPWAWRLAVASYSSGPGTVARIVRPAAGVSALPDSERWSSLGEHIRAAAAEGAREWGGVPIRGRWKAAATIVRAEQRHATGLLLAGLREPAAVPWFAAGALPEALSTDLAELGYGGA